MFFCNLCIIFGTSTPEHHLAPYQNFLSDTNLPSETTD